MNDIKKRLNDSAAMRWSMLLLMALITFSIYYINDVFSSMKSIMEVQFKMDSDTFGLLLSAVSFANILGMIILGGIILDRIGIRKTGLFFISIAAFGTVLIAYGGSDFFTEGAIGYSFFSSFLKSYTPRLKMMILGQALFGLGLETCCVLVQKVIVKWFEGKEMAMAFGVNMAMGRLGQYVALNAAPILVGSMVAGMYPDFSRALWMGAALACISLVFFLVYWVFDVRIDKESNSGKAAAAEEEFHLGDAIKLLSNKSFIYITALCVTYYAAVFPFINYATDMLENKFGYEKAVAAQLTGFLPIASIIFTPLFGRLVDKKGRSATLMILGSCLVIIAHLLLSLTNISPYISLAALGIAFSLVPAAMWPAVPRIVPASLLGTAYAIMFTMQNWGLFTFKRLIGTVLQKTNPGITPEMIAAKQAVYDYTWPIFMLAFLGLAGIMFALLLKREDKVSGFGLEKPKSAA